VYLKAFTVGLEARQLSPKSGQEEEEACFASIRDVLPVSKRDLLHKQ
jgi:hypothetical protein